MTHTHRYLVTFLGQIWGYQTYTFVTYDKFLKQNIQDTQIAKAEPSQKKNIANKWLVHFCDNRSTVNNRGINYHISSKRNCRAKVNSFNYSNSQKISEDEYIRLVLQLNNKTKKDKFLDIRVNQLLTVYERFKLDKDLIFIELSKFNLKYENPETEIAKVEPTEAQDKGIPKNLIGSYEGKNSQGDPFKLNINTNKYGEIIGNYTYEVNNKIYGGPLYDGKLLDDQTLKIFWTEGETNGWFKFKFQENFAKLDGDWGFIENNIELPKKGKYKGVRTNTAIANKSEQNEFKPKNNDY